jgi:Winged helix DNA-binding domain
MNIAYQRLANQQISEHHFLKPTELVSWMGCIQAQDFAGAKWAIGNRLRDIKEAAIDKDFNEGKILRTHVLRPTWHFVLPADISWMLELTAPRVRMLSKGLHKKLEIDAKVLKRSKDVITKALAGGKELTRNQLSQLLDKAKINTEDIRVTLIMMDAELDGLICSGGRAGKQFTYALLEEKVPKSTKMDKDAALAELAKRYFISRGPATLQDFAWWSGLTQADAKQGVALNKKYLSTESMDGQAYWFSQDMVTAVSKTSVHLLPAFDEYTIAYKDRMHALHKTQTKLTGNGIFKPSLIIDGQIAGGWKRTEYRDKIIMEIQPFEKLNKKSLTLIRSTVERYGKFMEKETEVAGSI